MSDMKLLTMRDLNRKTASVMDALERGETFEIHRNGKVVGYLTRTAPPLERKPDWTTHVDWLKNKPKRRSAKLLAEFEEARRHLGARETVMGACGEICC